VADSTVIPGSVRSRISIRIVPDQDVEVVAASLQAHLESTFAMMQSPNRLIVNVDHTADWWLGSLNDPWFRALEAAVRDEWGVDPLRIREGGVSSTFRYEVGVG
jgi:di- and tripeptidase